MHSSTDISACPQREKINRDSFLDTLRDLAPAHTLRETLEILARVAGITMTYDTLKKTAQRHGIRFQPAAKGGQRTGAGRPQGSFSRDRSQGCSWLAGDYSMGGLATDTGSMPQEPFQAVKRSGMALLDTAWVLRVGSRLGPSHGRPDGSR